MWASLLIFGPSGLALSALHDPENLPIALTVMVGGTFLATLATVLARRRQVAADRVTN